MAESSGETLGGRYRLLGERASFPFGSWWEAEDDQGARTVVLRLHAEVADPAARTRKAIEICATVDTPHLVPWADGGVDSKGHGWLAAPMFGPWSLLEHVTRGEGGLSPIEATPLMHQLARAIASGEKASALHHALSSELVRLVPLPDGGYGVKIYGYGLEEVLPPYKPLLRKQDGYLGVPDYMSPEMCGGKPSEGSSSDIYALGILMYEAVRGRPPFAPTFASASASATLKRHIFEKPLALHVRYANAPHIKSYEAIAFKALNKAPNRRHASVAELEQELEQLLTGEMRQQVVPLAAISGRAPTTSRRLRTQVLSVAAETPGAEIASREAAEAAARASAEAEAAKRAEAERASAEAAERAKAEAERASAEAAERAKAEAERAKAEAERASAEAAERAKAEAERASAEAAERAKAEAERASAAAPARGSKRSEGTLVFAGLGPSAREQAEGRREERAPAEVDAEEEVEQAATLEPTRAMAAMLEPTRAMAAMPEPESSAGSSGGELDEDEEGSVEDEALPATAGPTTGRRGKRKKGRKGSQAVLAAATTGPTPITRPKTAPQPRPGIAPQPRSEAVTGETAAPAANVSAEPKEARIRRKDDTTVRNPGATDAVAAQALTASAKPAAAKQAARSDEQEDWFDQEEAGLKKGGSKVWIYLLLAALVVAVVIFFLTKGGGEAPRTPEPTGAATGPKYAIKETPPTEPKPAEVPPVAQPAVQPEVRPAEVQPEVKPAEVQPEVKPAEMKPAEVKPAEMKPAEVQPEVKPAEVKPAEVKPAEVKPAEVKPAEVKPAEVKPAEVKPAEVKPAEVKPAEVKPAEVKPAEVKPAEVKPAEVKPAEVKPAEVKPAEKPAEAGSPEEAFKAQVKHYMTLGLDSFKAENYQQAADHFRQAQKLDPSNKAAGAYLKRALEKLSQ